MSTTEEREEEEVEGGAVRFPPPLVPVIGLAVGLLATRGFGPLPNRVTGVGRFAAGGFLIVAGLGCIVAAFGLSCKHRVPR